MFKKIFMILIALFVAIPVHATNNVWINDLKNLFLSNNAIIYEINIRTFTADDKDGNGIIDFQQGETSGNFITAISRLDEIKNLGINTIHVLPIMKVGKTQALGTAGSLYAPSSFDELNPQLKDLNSSLSLENQAIKFINEAHKRRIRIIVDLPSCGSYPLYSKHPELFLKDATGQPVTIGDRKDIRLFDAGDETKINDEVYRLYQNFTDYVTMLGVDGIRADKAALKPAKFWKALIEYSTSKNPQLLWLADANESNSIEGLKGVTLTSYDKLLEAGFDGFYGSWAKLKDWRSASEVTGYIKSVLALQHKYGKTKSVIGSFTTHDELSPVLINGIPYSSMIIWLNSTLPINSYYVDGFPTGDNYIYFWSNKKAPVTFTDNEYYFTDRGKLDIYNFSRKPDGNNKELQDEFTRANVFKGKISSIMTNGKFVELRTNNDEIFAYTMNYDKSCLVVFGNINFRKTNADSIRIPNYNNERVALPIQLKSVPVFENGKFNIELQPAEVQVLLIDNFEVK